MLKRMRTQDEGSGSARRRRPQDSQDDARLGDVSKGKGRNRDRWTLRERQGKSLANRERRSPLRVVSEEKGDRVICRLFSLLAFC